MCIVLTARCSLACSLCVCAAPVDTPERVLASQAKKNRTALQATERSAQHTTHRQNTLIAHDERRHGPERSGERCP